MRWRLPVKSGKSINMCRCVVRVTSVSLNQFMEHHLLCRQAPSQDKHGQQAANKTVTKKAKCNDSHDQHR